jgi:hypothetical protein
LELHFCTAAVVVKLDCNHGLTTVRERLLLQFAWYLWFDQKPTLKMRLFGILAWISLLAVTFSTTIGGEQDEEKFEFQAEVSRLMDSTFS